MTASQSDPSDLASWTPSRIKQTLLRNPAVDGDDTIAELIIASGSLGKIPAGTEFITIGPSNDEVYFLLSGTADVHLPDGKRVRRTSPTQVGEMAVLDRGSPRSACVKAANGGVTVWKIDGDSLCDIFTSYPAFKERMRSEMAGRHRELAANIPSKSGWAPVAWTLISLFATGLFVCIAWWLAALAGATILIKAVLSAAVGLVTYIFVSGRNPAFFWRRMMMALIIFAGTVLGLQRSIKVDVSNGEQIAKFELSSDGITVSESTMLAIIASWSLVFAICGYLEYRRDKNA